MLKLDLLQNSNCILDKTKVRYYINVILLSRMSLNRSLSISESPQNRLTEGTEMFVSYLLLLKYKFVLWRKKY